MINWKEHIEINEAVLQGKPRVKNTRIAVELIIEKLAEGESISQILESHPNLTTNSVYACLAYASDSLRNEINYSIAS